jgi:uncharacterized membrane protein
MQVPFHPLVVHFPLALTFVLPVLVLVFAWMIKVNKMTPKGWLVIVGLQLTVVVSGYVALETGEKEEHTVERVVAKGLIHEHEEAAEIFVGASVLALVLSVGAFFIRKELGFPMKLGIAAIGLVSCFLAYRAGRLGGELVYVHGAANAYHDGPTPNALLPTPGQNTSESPFPVEENESLKPDENDYGTSDEPPGSDEDLKQED